MSYFRIALLPLLVACKAEHEKHELELPGQSVTLSSPRGGGEAAPTIELTRHDDRLLVRSVALTN